MDRPARDKIHRQSGLPLAQYVLPIRIAIELCLRERAERDDDHPVPPRILDRLSHKPFSHLTATQGGGLHPIDQDINRIIAMVRARVEHPFRVLKRQSGYLKTRYRALAKNRAQLFTLFTLGNLFLVRQRLMS